MPIEQPTIKRAVSEILSIVTSTTALAMTLVVLMVAALATGIFYGNVTVGSALGVAVVTLILIFIEYMEEWRWFYVVNWLIRGVDRRTAQRNAYNDYFVKDLSDARISILFGIPVLILLASNFIFLQDANWIWVVNGDKTTISQKYVTAIPYVSEIRWVSKYFALDFDVFATTADGTKIRGHVKTDMHILQDKTTVVRLTRGEDPDSSVVKNAQGAIQLQFWRQIAKQKIADVKPSIVLEYIAGRQAQPGIDSIGVNWNGTLVISDIHPYFN